MEGFCLPVSLICRAAKNLSCRISYTTHQIFLALRASKAIFLLTPSESKGDLVTKLNIQKAGSEAAGLLYV